MLKKIDSIRFFIVRSQVLAAIITGLFFFVGLQLFLIFVPSASFSLANILWLSSYVFIVGILVASYTGYQSSHLLKNRIERLSTFITTLTRGNYSKRYTVSGNDELSIMSADLNELAHKIEAQVLSLQNLADEKAALANKAHTAAAIEERQRLARDLHDAVSQQLFALSMMSSAALRVFERNPEQAKQQVKEIAEMAAHAQVEMRALLLHLRPVHLRGESLIEGLEKLIGELETKCTIDFDLDLALDSQLSKGAEDHIFRICQEALSNILRHAEATEVKIRFSSQPNDLYIYISDNGKGFDPENERKTSYGLKTMKERAEQIGGTLNVKSRREEGTYLTIRVPLKGEEQK